MTVGVVVPRGSSRNAESRLANRQAGGFTARQVGGLARGESSDHFALETDPRQKRIQDALFDA